MTDPTEPMSREAYAAALADLDRYIERIDLSTGYWDGTVSDAIRNHASVVSSLTEALVAVAKGVRLLAEPPSEITKRGSFTLIGSLESDDDTMVLDTDDAATH